MNYTIQVYIKMTEDGEMEGYYDDKTKFLAKTFDEIIEDIEKWRKKEKKGLNVEVIYRLP